MARVRMALSRRHSVSGPAPQYRQSSQSNDANSIPLSSIPVSLNQNTSPRSEISSRFSPDAALPSTESDSTNETTPNISTPSTPSTSAARALPFISVTPARLTFGHDSNPENAGRQRETISVLGTQLGELRLSSTRPASVKDAPQAAETGRDSRSSPLLDPTPSPRRLSTGRRRSGSQNNLPKHDVRDEAPLNDRFNIPVVQAALRNTKGLMCTLADVLRSSAVHNEPDSVMKRLCRQAEDLAEFKCSSTRIVGFVGDSGAGKSSLLNSLLDCKNLARSSSGGLACTCVVTEFHYHEDEAFAIRVERFSETELMPQLEDLLRDYRHFHLNRHSFDSNESSHFEKRARLASDTFQALFRRLFVERNTLIEDTESKALSTLKSWVRSFNQSTIPQEHFGLSFNECSTLLMELTSDTPTSIWPWIKKIRVYLNAHILSKGLILADLPGLRDFNSARRNTTERYLLECDEIFVVAIEGRAATDEGVQNVIELAKKAKLSNVGIVCTKSDEITSSEALKDWKGKEVCEKIEKIDNGIYQQNEEVEWLKQEISYLACEAHNLDDEERAELVLLSVRLNSTEQLLNGYRFDRQKLLVTTRNVIVEKKLVTLYIDAVPDNLLKVFCASNATYWDYRDKSKDEATPYLELSGILAIREHCMMIVSESQYTASEKYMRDNISAFLGELDLWVQSGKGSLSAENKEKVRNTLDTVERKLDLGLCGRTSALNGVANVYKNEFITKIYRPHGSNVGRWSTAAKNASTDWTSWPHQTYSAFCRNHGTYSTAAVGSRSWNQEIIEEMIQDTSTPCDELEMSLVEQRKDIVKTIDDLFSWVDEFLDTGLGESPGTAFSLTSTLLSQKRVLKADIETVLNDLKNDLQMLRTDALSSIRTSFIGKAMENAYTSARFENGRGSDARKKAIIHSAVKRNCLFPDLLESFKNGFNDYVDGAQERIREIVGSHFDAIKGTLQIVRGDNVTLESEMDPEFRGRVESRLEATRGEMERVYSTLTA
ncbi:hypothetical protein F4803DRAFT_527987 [Xylaria telfairii]|nr:hypothetical protein F4803DRAFT_527987 [Xylaria telfairii]